MKWLTFVSVMLFAAGAIGQDRGAKSSFTYVDLMIDSKGTPLAAWQVEVAAEVGNVSLVGIEMGEHAAYAKRPAYYDPAALAGKRIILGDYSLDADLPKAKTRVARLMFEVRGDTKPQYVTKLMAASDGDGKAIAAAVSVVEK